MKPLSSSNRREFLQWSAVAGIAGGLAAKNVAAESETELGVVKKYNRLGRTDLEISDISMGTSSLRPGQEDLVKYALDRGINYFDSAESYGRGVSETVVGNALKSVRDQVYIVSKAMTNPNQSAQSHMDSLEGSLRRLQSDYVDIYMCHAVNDIERLQSEGWREFLVKAKEQGKIRFTGVSGHAGRLAECLDYAIDEDLADVFLCAYNFGQDPSFVSKFTRGLDWIAKQPELPRILEKARKKDIGITTMKTLMGARLNDMAPYEKDGSTFAQAAFKWVLSNSNVSAVVITMTQQQQVDEYLGASGKSEVSSTDLELLNRYISLNGSTYCRQGCNGCADACPYGVQISEVLRTRMYAVDYGDLEMARQEYSMIDVNGEACLSCSGQPCQSACIHGLAIDKLCEPTHRMLS